MKGILAIIKHRWFAAVIGLLAIALIVWLLGPLFAIAGYEPLAAPLNRLLLIAGLVMIWLAKQLLQAYARHRRNRQMVDGVLAPQSEPVDPAQRESAEELVVLNRRLQEAISILKASKLGGRYNRQYLYQLPWYIFIGPPGSGKTTALLNSGLHFPLADKLGADAVQGVGGTRNCDWWFTDDAVLLDTAGRYTTQDSYEAVDRAAWNGFLELLKRHRRRRPINGALVAISIADLLQQTELERLAHAKAIRMRIKELIDSFGIRFPIYVLFTKCDLLAGFNEFFEPMSREERSQVWGMTFPFEERSDPETGISGFRGEFRELERHVDARLLDRLEHERDPKRRILIYAFPQQFSSIREVAEGFLQEAFNVNRYQETPMVRGVYFTSGTQEGTPIDRLLGAMAQEFGLNRQIAPAFSGSGRSYFIKRLFKDLIFPEAHLAGVNLRVERQRAWLQRFAYTAVAGCTLLAAGAWFTSYSRNQGYVQQVAFQAQAAQQKVDGVVADDLSLIGLLPALDTLRQIPGGYADQGKAIPWMMGLGLYQGDKLGAEAIGAYHNALRNLMLPRIILSLEQQLRERGNNSDYLYEALKVYLMFDDREHFDADTMKAWMLLQWQLTLPGPEHAQARQALANHLQALLEIMPMPPSLPLDEALVRSVRDELLRLPLAERVYSRLKRTSRDHSVVPPLKLDRALGPSASLLFTRRSGESLNAEIPALYTNQGYHKLFLKAHLEIANRLLEEKWILGPELERLSGRTDLGLLSARVQELYYEDYIQVWEGLLADVRVVPLRNLSQAVEVLNLLSSRRSPLVSYLKLLQQQTRLAQLPGAMQQAAENAGEAGGNITDRLAAILQVERQEAAPPQPEEVMGTPVDSHFAELHRLLRSVDGEMPGLQEPLALLNDLYAYVNGLATSRRSTQLLDAARETGSGSVIGRLRLEAKRQPEPLTGILQTLAIESSNLAVTRVREQMNAVWTTQLRPFCQRSLEGRYPLDPHSGIGVTISDFGRFFGPGGMMQNFFDTYLKDFVDTSSRIWRWNAAGSRTLGIPTSTLSQFQRAAVIRDAFFEGGEATPLIHFKLKPLNMDTTIRQITLLIANQRVTYNHGPTRWSRLVWPDDSGISDTKVLLAPPSGDLPSGLSEDGPWGWFRMLDRARTSTTNSPETIEVKFDVGGRQARFQLRSSGALNPFMLKEIVEFQCPSRL
ncbi:MAG: type VI secretion system membrane subunit TssM [Candidatus Thiodiazotropha sp.]